MECRAIRRRGRARIQYFVDRGDKPSFRLFLCYQINAKYDKEVEEDVRRWIENVLEEPVEWGSEDSDSPGSGFADGLMDGEILCKYDML